MSRKAEMSIKIVVVIVAVLIALGVLLYFLWGVGSKTKAAVNDTCAESVRLHKDFAKLSRGDVSTDITCPTEKVQITSTDQDEVKKHLADKMADCWYKWGRGEYDLFQGKQGAFCHVCSRITFNTGASGESDGAKTIDNFGRYLGTHTLPSDTSKTYLEYLSGVEKGDMFSEEKLDQLESPSIKTSKDYAVIYVHIRGKDRMKDLWKKTKEAAPGAGVAGAGGLVLLSNPGGWIVGGVVVAVGGAMMAGGTIWAAASGYYAEAEHQWLARTVLVEYSEKELNKLGCQRSYAKQTVKKTQ